VTGREQGGETKKNNIMDDYNDNLAEYYLSLEYDEEYLPENVKQTIAQTQKILKTVIDTREFAFQAMTKALKTWSRNQYPSIKTVKDDFLDDCYLDIYFDKLYFASFITYKLVEDLKTGINPRKAFNKFDQWEKELTKTPKPKLLKQTDRSKFANLTNEQWKRKLREENEMIILRFNYYQKCKPGFIGMLKKTLQKLFPEVANFGPDELAVYNYVLNYAYEPTLKGFERLMKFIDCNIELKHFSQKDEELAETISKLPKKIQDEVKAKEMRRLQGEKI